MSGCRGHWVSEEEIRAVEAELGRGRPMTAPGPITAGSRVRLRNGRVGVVTHIREGGPRWVFGRAYREPIATVRLADGTRQAWVLSHLEPADEWGSVGTRGD